MILLLSQSPRISSYQTHFCCHRDINSIPKWVENQVTQTRTSVPCPSLKCPTHPSEKSGLVCVNQTSQASRSAWEPHSTSQCVAGATPAAVQGALPPVPHPLSSSSARPPAVLKAATATLKRECDSQLCRKDHMAQDRAHCLPSARPTFRVRDRRLEMWI